MKNNDLISYLVDNKVKFSLNEHNEYTCGAITISPTTKGNYAIFNGENYVATINGDRFEEIKKFTEVI